MRKIALRKIDDTKLFTLRNCHLFILQKESSTTITERLDVDPVMIYHVLQTCAFCLMATIIMRLKLFFTPQLCILTALLLNVKVILICFINPIEMSLEMHLKFLSRLTKIYFLVLVCTIYSFSSIASFFNCNLGGRHEH